MASSYDEGGIEEFLHTVPAVCFVVEKTMKLLTKKRTMTYPSEVRASCGFGSLGVALSTRELWKLDWLPGSERVCRIQSLYNESLYWLCLDRKNKNDHLVVAPFKQNEDGTISGQLNNKKIIPSEFYVNIVGSHVALQQRSTKLWLSVNRKEEIKLQDAFSEKCQLLVGSKVGLYVTGTSLGSTYRQFFTVTNPLWGCKMYLQNLWADKNSILLLIPLGGSFAIFTGKGNFLTLKSDQLVHSASKLASASHFKFKSGPNGECRLFLVAADQSYETPIVPDASRALGLVSRVNDPKPDDGLFYITFIPEKSLKGSTDPGQEDSDDESTQPQVPPENPVFGVPIPELLAREGTEVPLVVQHAVQFLRQNYEHEGMFRLSGSKKVIEQLRVRIDYGELLKDIIKERNVGEDEVAGLLKLFISESHLISQELLKTLTDVVILAEKGEFQGEKVRVECGNDSIEYPVSQRQRYREIMNNEAPKYVCDTLGYLCKFFHELAKLSDVNRMGASNISIVIVPNLHRDYFTAPKFSTVFQTLLIDYYGIFI